jgi:hypothetical protein
MIFRGNRHGRMRWAACSVVLGAMLAVAPIAQGAVIIFNDSWTDGGRTNGADPTDIDWWTSASSQGIEVSPGSMGMVTGSSGRGIHTTFPTRRLSEVGRKITATYTFTTPATVSSSAQAAAFRVGLFDHLGRTGLKADVPASSGMPNALYGWGTGNGGPGTAGLPGYMLDMDVAQTTASNDLSFRSHNTDTVGGTGRLMGTTTGFTQLSPTGPDGAFSFTPNTTYTGSFSIERINATQMRLTATLGSASHTITDTFDSDRVGMLAFWANSNIFGSSQTPNTPNNGIDFSNINVVFIPEPGTALCVIVATLIGCCTGMRWQPCRRCRK